MGRAISCCRYETKREITLIIIGLDNSGKTSAVRHLQKESTDDVVPTVGFSNIVLQDKHQVVHIFDLGGGSKIRGIWKNYYALSYGVIFVVDSTDAGRLEECKNVLEEVIKDQRITGKPILVFVNKQDKQNSMDENEVCQILNLEQLVNEYKCPTRVETTSTLQQKPNISDQGIVDGYKWMLTHIANNFTLLNSRVTADTKEQKEREHKELEEKINRIRKLREERELLETQTEEKDIGLTEDPFKPISSYVVDEGLPLNNIHPSNNHHTTSSNEVKKSTPIKFFKNKVSPESHSQESFTHSTPKAENGLHEISGDKINWGLAEEL